MKRKNDTGTGVALRLLFALYCLFVFAVLFIGRRGSQPQFGSFELYMRDCFNVVPFANIAEYFSYIMNGGYVIRNWAIKNMLGNLLLFYPMGIFLPCLFSVMRTLRSNIRISFFAILSVETVQMLLRIGSFDVDDIILNMAGWILGSLTLRIPPIRRVLIQIHVLEE